MKLKPEVYWCGKCWQCIDNRYCVVIPDRTEETRVPSVSPSKSSEIFSKDLYEVNLAYELALGEDGKKFDKHSERKSAKLKNSESKAIETGRDGTGRNGTG